MKTIAEALYRVVDEEVIKLATALSIRPGTDRGVYFDIAFRMGGSEPAEKSAVAEFDSWLSTGSLLASQVRLVLAEHDTTLAAWNSTWVHKLLAQWIGQNEPEFAQLVVEFGGDAGATELIAKLVSIPVPEVPTRAQTAVVVLSKRPEDLGSLVVALADWVLGVVPIATIGKLAKPLAAIEALGVDTTPVATRIRDRAPELSTPVDLDTLVTATAELDRGGVQSAKSAADALASRGAAIGLAEAGSAQWLAERSSEQAFALKIVADTIKNTATGTAEAITLANSCRRPLARKAAVALALVVRANHPSGNEDEARSLLTEALGWKPQPAESKPEYERNLSDIASRWSALDGLVNELKGVGKRKR